MAKPLKQQRKKVGPRFSANMTCMSTNNQVSVFVFRTLVQWTEALFKKNNRELSFFLSIYDKGRYFSSKNEELNYDSIFW